MKGRYRRALSNIAQTVCGVIECLMHSPHELDRMVEFAEVCDSVERFAHNTGCVRQVRMEWSLVLMTVR